MNFQGIVDAADGSLVTIVVRSSFHPRLKEGDTVTVIYHDDDVPHVCDWRFVGRRQDRFAEVVCIAAGHDTNTRLRMTALMVADDQLPKYDGQFDV